MVTKLKAAARKRIVPKWYKKWSVWISAGIAGASGAILVLPDRFVSWIPPDWQGVAVLLVIVAAAIKQNNLTPPNG